MSQVGEGWRKTMLTVWLSALFSDAGGCSGAGVQGKSDCKETSLLGDSAQEYTQEEKKDPNPNPPNPASN